MNKNIPLIKILKSRGPRIEPWGIPLITLAQSLHEVSIFVFCSQKPKQSLTKGRLGLSRSYSSSFAGKRS